MEFRFRERDCEELAIGNTARVDYEDVLSFRHLEHPISSTNRQHPLTSVVVAIVAILVGANGPTAIAKWAKFNPVFLEN